MSIFGDHFGVSAAAVKKWEDIGNNPIGSATNDFSIRNFVAKRLSVQFQMNVDIAIHKSVLEAGEYWKPERMEIPFEAMAKYAREMNDERRVS